MSRSSAQHQSIDEITYRPKPKAVAHYAHPSEPSTRSRVIRVSSAFGKEVERSERRDKMEVIQHVVEAPSPPPDASSRSRSSRSGAVLEGNIERLKRPERVASIPTTSTAPPGDTKQSRMQLPAGSEVDREEKSIFSPFTKFFSPRPAAPSTEDSQRRNPAEQVENQRPFRIEPSEPQAKRTHSSPVELEGYFSQPIEDSSITQRVMGLQQAISTHVDNYYGEMRHPPPNEIFWKALKLSDEDIQVQKTVSDQESFRLAAIQRDIARSSLKKIALDGDPDKTFLPQSIVSLLRITPKHESEKCKCNSRSLYSTR